MVQDCFSSLFKIGTFELNLALHCVKRKVTGNHNEMFMHPFCVEELRVAVFSMLPNKSAGVDGFNPGFYKNHWDVVGDAVVAACLN